MVEESVGPKTEPMTKGKKDSATQGVKDSKTQDKKSGDTSDKKAKKRKDETSTPEGQKRVTKNYRSGWKRIWGSKK